MELVTPNTAETHELSGHILIYRDSLRSYRDLPVRLGELERCTATNARRDAWLLRVRGFTQTMRTSSALPTRSRRKSPMREFARDVLKITALKNSD